MSVPSIRGMFARSGPNTNARRQLLIFNLDGQGGPRSPAPLEHSSLLLPRRRLGGFLVTEDAPEKLPGHGLGDLVDDLDLPRILVGGNLRLAELDDLVRRRRGTRLERHEGL